MNSCSTKSIVFPFLGLCFLLLPAMAAEAQTFPTGVFSIGAKAIPAPINANLKEVNSAIGRITVVETKTSKVLGHATGYTVAPGDKFYTAFHNIEKNWFDDKKGFSVRLEFPGEKPFDLTELVEFDKPNDLAIFKLKEARKAFLNLVDRKKIEIGMPLAVLGYPGGSSQMKVSLGHISVKTAHKVIHGTTAVSIPGCSGSPAIMLDERDKIIGVVGTVIGSASLNFTFSMVDELNSVATNLRYPQIVKELDFKKRGEKWESIFLEKLYEKLEFTPENFELLASLASDKYKKDTIDDLTVSSGEIVYLLLGIEDKEFAANEMKVFVRLEAIQTRLRSLLQRAVGKPVAPILFDCPLLSKSELEKLSNAKPEEITLYLKDLKQSLIVASKNVTNNSEQYRSKLKFFSSIHSIGEFVEKQPPKEYFDSDDFFEKYLFPVPAYFVEFTK